MKQIDRDGIGSDSPEFVTALARGLAVIRAFERGDEALTISQISSRINVSRAAVRRILLTLEALGYVASDGGSFVLRPAILTLSGSYMNSNALARCAQPLLAKLAVQFGGTWSLGRLEQDFTVIVAGAETRTEVFTAAYGVGKLHPLYCTASGRLFLSQMSNSELRGYFDRITMRKYTDRTCTNRAAIIRSLRSIRESAYASVDGEYVTKGLALAVPILNSQDSITAAITAADPWPSNAAHVAAKLLPAMRKCAEELGYLFLNIH